MKTFIIFKKNDQTIGYALAYPTETGWTFPIVRVQKPFEGKDLKDSDVINAETGEKLFILDNLFFKKSDGIFELKGQIL